MSDAETAAVISLIDGLFTSNVSTLVRHFVCFLNVYFLVLHRYCSTVLIIETICSRHGTVAFVTLLCYDYCLTFGREVSLLINHRHTK